MKLTGKVASFDDGVVEVILDERFKHSDLNMFDDVEVITAQNDPVTPKQRKFAHALINDIAQSDKGGKWAGDNTLVRGYFNDLFAYYYDDKTISLSRERGNKLDTNLFIDLLVRFCVEHKIGHYSRYIDELDEDFIYPYEYLCVIHKICVICNKPGDLHHLTGSKIGMGNNRNKVNHKGRMVIELCREHHNKWHEREKEMMAAYKLNGVAVNDEIARVHRLRTKERKE